MNVKVISRYVGSALLVDALFMLLSVVVSISRGNDSALAALLISFAITFVCGAFPFIFVRKNQSMTTAESYVMIVMSWLLSFIFGMLPYILWGGPFTVVNAFFESVSGFTTTGASILSDIESLPDSLLFWRSSTHFIGGLGVVVFLLLILPNAGTNRNRLSSMELSSLSKDAYMTRVGKTAFIFAYVYLTLTVLVTISYVLAGMSLFDAINHAFSVVASGGFSTKNLSLEFYDSKAINIITIVFMFLCSLHYGMLYMTVINRTLKPLKNPVLKSYFFLVAALSIVVAIDHKFAGLSFGNSLINGFFESLTYITGTGLAIMPIGRHGGFIIFLLACACLSGGCAGSTTGALKFDRVLVLLKSARAQIHRNLHPSAINGVRLGKRLIPDSEIYPHIIFCFIFLIAFAVSMVVGMLCGLGGIDSIVGTVASLCNTGLTLEPFDMNALPALLKIYYSFNMFLGRVEIYPLLAVASMIITRSK